MPERVGSGPGGLEQADGVTVGDVIDGSGKRNMWRLGLATWWSRVRAPGGESEVGRSLPNRVERRRILRRMEDQTGSHEEIREERKKMLKEAASLDLFDEQFVGGQRFMEVKTKWGEMGMEVVDVDLHRDKMREDGPKRKTAVLVTSWAGSNTGTMSLVRELAMRGYRVIGGSQPEDYRSRPTKEFVEAVREAGDYGPHAELYQQMMEQILDSDEECELWGSSAGGLIVAEMLGIPEVQKRVTNAVLINTAGLVDQSLGRLLWGVARETWGYLLRSRVGWEDNGTVVGSRTPGKNKYKEELQKMTIGFVLKKAEGLFRAARVREGGKIVVIGGENDQTTQGKKAADVFADNPQAEVEILPKRIHMTLAVEARLMADTANKMLGRMTGRRRSIDEEIPLQSDQTGGHE